MIQIQIKNFRSIQNIELKSDSNLIALIGPNDSGKSNILDSIMSLSPMTTYKEDDFLNWSNSKQSKEIELNLKIEHSLKKEMREVREFIKKWKKFDYANKIIPFLEKNFEKIKKIKIQIYRKIVSNLNQINQTKDKVCNENFMFLEGFKENLYSIFYSSFKKDIDSTGWKLEPNPDKILKAFNFQRNFFLFLLKKLSDIHKKNFIEDFIKIYFFFHNIAIKSPKIKRINFHSLVHKKHKDDLNFSLGLLKEDIDNSIDWWRKILLEKWFNLLGIDKNEIILLFENNSWNQIRTIILKAKNTANKKLLYIRKQIGETNRINIAIEFLPNNIFSIFLKNENENEDIVFLDKLAYKSDGIKQFLILCLEIMSVKEEISTILIIDEPEAHLNPLYQEKILELFEWKAQKDNIFIIYATHSPFMINKSRIIDRKIIYRSEKTNETKVMEYYDKPSIHDISCNDARAMDMTLSKFNELKEYLKYTSGGNFDKILFVEGYTDEIILTNFLNKFYPDSKIALFSLMGYYVERTLPLICDFFKQHLNGGNVYFVLDKDFAGDATKKIIQKFLLNDKREELSKSNVKQYSDFLDFQNFGEKITLENFLGIDYKLTIKKARKYWENCSIDNLKHFHSLAEWITENKSSTNKE